MSGIFGYIGRGNAFVEVKTGLENLSHRGQESWGIVSGLRDGSFSEVRRLGSIFHSPLSVGPILVRWQSARSAIPLQAKQAREIVSP